MTVLSDPDLGDDVMVVWYVAFFAARTDLYVSNSAEVVRDELTPDVFRHAVKHNYPLSGYMATEAGRTHVGAIDFDTEDGATQAELVQALLWRWHVASLLEESRRGAHLWVCTSMRVSQGVMHRALLEALNKVGLLPGQDMIEVFPHLSPDLGAGALRIPGLAHHNTQVRYPIRDGNGEQLTSMRDIINAHDWTMPEALTKLAASGGPKSHYPNGLGGFYGYKGPKDWGQSPSATDILTSWGVPNAKPGATVRCPKHEDKRRSLTIFKDDERVYCGSPSCELHGEGRGVGSVMLAKME
jgi:hypothetical protein